MIALLSLQRSRRTCIQLTPVVSIPTPRIFCIVWRKEKAIHLCKARSKLSPTFPLGKGANLKFVRRRGGASRCVLHANFFPLFPGETRRPPPVPPRGAPTHVMSWPRAFYLNSDFFRGICSGQAATLNPLSRLLVTILEARSSNTLLPFLFANEDTCVWDRRSCLFRENPGASLLRLFFRYETLGKLSVEISS